MGINIQMYAEVWDGEHWKPAEPLVANEIYDPEDDPAELSLRPQGLYYSVRNRSLFAILCDAVEDHIAEVPVRPIAPCRGLPGDVSSEILEFERHSLDDSLFGHSWLTLAELVELDWPGQVVQMAAMVDPGVAYLFEDNPLGFPYQRWPQGKQISCWSRSPMGVGVRWRETCEQSAGPEFMEGVLPYLKSFGPPECVRIVFWFNA